MMWSLVIRGSTTEIIWVTESVCSEDRRVCGLYSEWVSWLLVGCVWQSRIQKDFGQNRLPEEEISEE